MSVKKLEIVLSSKFTPENPNYKGFLSCIDHEYFLGIKSLKDISFPFNRDTIQVVTDEDNQEIDIILAELEKGFHTEFLKNKIVIDSNYANLDEYYLINQYFSDGVIIDVTKIAEHKLRKILNEVAFNKNIRFIDKYNLHSKLTQKELKEVYSIIERITKIIKQYDFSPLEQLLFIFDSIREKTYREEESLSSNESRDFYKIVKGDYIVCEGYFNLVSSICTSLNIENEAIIWQKNGKSTHISNLIYLNDDKYNIHGIYDMDITASYKRNEEETDYLNNYRFALVPFEISCWYKKKENYEFFKDSSRNSIVKYIYDYKKRLDEMNQLGIPDGIKSDFYKILLDRIAIIAKKLKNDYLEELCNQKTALDDDRVSKIYEKFLDLGRRKIPDNALIKSIYKVRRIEHLMNPQKYPLDPDIFENIINHTIPQSGKQRLLGLIMGLKETLEVVEEIPVINQISGETSREKIMKDLKRIELLNTLKSELQNKSSRNKI